MRHHATRLGWPCAALLVLSACGGGTAGSFGDGGLDGTVGARDSGGVHGGDGGIRFGSDTGSVDTGAPSCTGLACDVSSCSGDPKKTKVTGYVYAPNGELPLYDVQVFIPNAALVPFSKGVQCENCGAPLSGEPITTALSDPTGAFTLEGVPAGDNIPIVVQLGKWRRQATLAKVKACETTTLTDPNLTRLPKNQKEGSMPHVALTAGGCDQMGCMLTKIGIDPAEFGSETDGYAKAINVYNGEGGGAGLGATPALDLWGSEKTLFTYDEAIFSCECSEALDSKGGAALGGAPFGVVTDYLNAGGRIFTTDYQYTWYKYSPDPGIGEATAGSDTIGLEIHGGAPGGASPMILSTTLPKAVALAAWLKNVFSGVVLPSGATYPLDPSSQMGEVTPDVVFGNVQWLNPASTVTWASSAYEGSYYGGPPPPPADAGGIEPRIFTVDTPVGKPSDKQCGRGVHIDAHVDQSSADVVGPGYPTSGCSDTLKADEAAFAFFFFDLSSCISNETEPPQPPPPGVPPPK